MAIKLNEEEIKKAAKYVPITSTTTLDQAIKLLDDAKNENRNIYFMFQGKPLYSYLDDEDSCYKKVVGRTKTEMLEEIAEIEEIKDTAKFDDSSFEDIDEVIEYLKEQGRKGNNVYINFNFKGEQFTFYSLLDAVPDKVYKTVTGFEKADYDANQQKIAQLIEDSMEVIYPEDRRDWVEYVTGSVEDLRKGKDAELALKIIKRLYQGNEKEAHEIASEAGDRELIFALNAIAKFSEDGIDFYKKEMKRLDMPPTAEEIRKLENQNKRARDRLVKE